MNRDQPKPAVVKEAYFGYVAAQLLTEKRYLARIRTIQFYSYL